MLVKLTTFTPTTPPDPPSPGRTLHIDVETDGLGLRVLFDNIVNLLDVETLARLATVVAVQQLRKVALGLEAGLAHLVQGCHCGYQSQ